MALKIPHLKRQNGHIKTAGRKSLSAIKNLVNSGYRGECSRQGWTTEADLLDGIRIDDQELKSYFSNPKVTILAYSNLLNRIEGCVYLEDKSPQLYLGMLTVKPNLQNQGIGKMLLNAAEEVAESLSCTSIIITVIYTRSELIAWYERQGYRKTGERVPFPADTRFGIPKQFLEFIVMEKILQTVK